MLNLWKKIQEKGRISSPKKNVDVTALGPQYDGPLKCFDVDACDFAALEKCRLSLNDIHDIYDNKSAYLYFSSFLEMKMAVEVLHLYDTLLMNDKETNRISPNNVADRLSPMQCNINSTSGENGRRSTGRLDMLNETLLKLPDEIQSKILFGNSKLVDSDSNTLNLAVFKTVLQEVLAEYWTEFVHSEWYFRYQVDLLTSRSVTLGDILGHEIALTYFMQFLEIEACSNVVEFWLAVTNFKQFAQSCSRNEQVDETQILNDAIGIYEKYLSLLATCPLGFNDNIRCAVEEAICDETGAPNADCFEVALNTVLTFLRIHYLVPFLTSQHYVHMLSDLIRSSSSIINHSPSSSVSEYCTDTRGSHLTKFDPDSVWRRRKRSGLSFGHVDQLGRFQSDIEPDPDRISESKLSKIMKKWVQRSATRVEEEMAWQVAEMVIKDITNLTMGSSVDNYESENSAKTEK